MSQPVVPAGLQPGLREVPALAWTVTRAFAVVPPAGQQRPALLRMLSALWSVPTLLVLYLPGLLVEVRAGHVARVDRQALLVVRPTGLGLGWGSFAVLVIWLTVLILPLQLFAPPLVLVALGVPLLVDMAGVLRAGRRSGSGSAARAKQLTGQGYLVATVALYAANPRGQGHGSALLDLLMRQAPAGLWLLAAARDRGLAQMYSRRYGFQVWDPARPLLLERPPAPAPALRQTTAGPPITPAPS